MKRRMLALGIALIVNGAALATVNVAMLDGAERGRLPQQGVERVVIVAERQAEALAAKNCADRKAL